MSIVRYVSVVMAGLVLFGASGCGDSSTSNPSPVAAEDAAKASAAMDLQNQQTDPLLKGQGKKK